MAVRPATTRDDDVRYSGQSASSGNASASNGGGLRWRRRPGRRRRGSRRRRVRVKASRVRASGSTSQRWATPFAAVEGALLGQVEAAGAGGEDLADPVGGEVEEGGVGEDRHALAAPAGEVGDEDVGAEVELGLDGEVPAAGAAGAALERAVELAGHAKLAREWREAGRGWRWRRPLAISATMCGGRVEDVLVGGGAVGRAWVFMGARIARRGRGVITGARAVAERAGDD